jgi:glucose-6-phosphate dehydrogenase assembly protein OpcA
MTPIEGTINPEVIERELAQLWQQTARAVLQDLEPGEERATMRARVANLMIYVSSEVVQNEVNEILSELSSHHPCRALVMIAAPEAADRDIDVVVNSFCHGGAEKSLRRLCCEEVSLSASGRYVVELPSAAIPLLVPDLPVFLWWREDLQRNAAVFAELADRADRVIIDSADLRNPGRQMAVLGSIVSSKDEGQAGFSDLNWARLTSWRALLAGFFDTELDRTALDQIVNVRVDYAAKEGEAATLASQPLLIAGWLASRLNWKITKPAAHVTKGSHTVKFEHDGRPIQADFLQAEPHQLLPGRLARIILTTRDSTAFEVSRSQDGLYLQTSINHELAMKHARVSPSHTRSVADLLSGEMDILCRDLMWEEAVRKAAEIAG